nr:unnamed protein product [Digitaria exilis]
MGAAYGTARSGVGVANMGVMRPELVTKSIVPIVMAGVLGIYGLIVAVIITSGISPGAKPYYLYDGFVHLTGGLSAGMCSLASGMAIGIVGDAGVRANAQQPKLYPGMIIILIFAEALALYGLIIGIIISTRAGQSQVAKAAFEVAAAAARHPNPSAFALFASSMLPDVSLLLASKSGLDIDRLSSLDIRHLSSVLLPYPLPDEPCRPRQNPCPRINGP